MAVTETRPGGYDLDPLAVRDRFRLALWDGEQLIDAGAGYAGNEDLAAALLGFRPARHVPGVGDVLSSRSTSPTTTMTSQTRTPNEWRGGPGPVPRARVLPAAGCRPAVAGTNRRLAERPHQRPAARRRRAEGDHRDHRRPPAGRDRAPDRAADGSGCRGARRAGGLELEDALAALGGPLRDRPAEAASLAAARAGLVARAEGTPLRRSCSWYRGWLDDLVRDGTLTRLARQGDAAVLGDAVRVLEHLAARPSGIPPVARPELAARVTGDTKSLNPGTTLATPFARASPARCPPRSAGNCGTGSTSSSATSPAGCWS